MRTLAPFLSYMETKSAELPLTVNGSLFLIYPLCESGDMVLPEPTQRPVTKSLMLMVLFNKICSILEHASVVAFCDMTEVSELPVSCTTVPSNPLNGKSFHAVSPSPILYLLGLSETIPISPSKRTGLNCDQRASVSLLN